MIKENVSFAVFSFVNILFSVKYFSRYTEYYLFFVVVLFIFHVFIFYKGNSLQLFAKRSALINSLLLIFFSIGSIFVFSKVPAESLNTDRWSVISSFWDNFFDKNYVYYAKSHLGNYPGPMPFYYILALPFYFIGELGFFSLSGIFVFFLLLKYMNIKPCYQTIALLLVLTSPFYFWEILSRSNIFLNATLIVFSIAFFFKIKKYDSFKNQLLLGTIIGLLLSTRNIFALCYVILFLYGLKSKKINIKSVMIIGCISLFAFALTFIPFVIGFMEDFLKMNPFIIQSSFLMPTGWVLVAIFCSFFLFLFCKKDADVLFYCGTILFFTIMLYFTYHSLSTSVYEAFIEKSTIDVSYFILCIPFFLCYILKDKTEIANTY
jgi:hypothetical protein